MRESMKVIKYLIMNNSINDRDNAELFELASREEIRDELEEIGEEWDFTLVRTFHDIYIVPLPDNELFNMRFREFRESITPNARKADAYLQCYIIIVILWMFFGSRNSDPQRTESLRIKDIVLKLDERFSDENKAEQMEAAQLNFHRIADKWNGNLYKDEGRKQSKTELVKTACRILIKNGLVIFADDEDEIRCRKRLSDLMKNYYLSDKRIMEINKLFEKEEEDHADDQPYQDS